MPAIIRTNNRLSIRLLRWVIITALLAGIILSLGQILLDADRAQNELDQQTLELMHVVQDAATQAVYSIDPELAQQVVEGLFEQRAIHLAIIAHPDGTPLAEKHRPLKESQSRWLTDLIFENERSFSVKLIKEIPEPVQYGILQVKIDTAYSAEVFLDRSLVVLASGVLRASILALILFMVYYYLLTKPLRQIIGSLITIDPKDPGEHNLPTPHNHEHDELGIWVKTANRLLKGISESQTKRKNAEERALKLSRYDPLTGLPNRLMFRNHLQLTLQDAAKLNKKVAVLCCGIDDFKSVNEQYSYNLGDKLLQAFAARLTRHSNLLHASARLGSDQFALVQFNIENAYKATELAEALLAAINMPFEIDGLTISVHSTIGITIFPDDGEDPDKLLQKSEQTMMLAKTQQRSQFQFYIASVDSEIRERKRLEKDLSEALGKDEFHLLYQPQLDYNSGRIVGAEALIRWIHPERGFVPPDHFIPIAENNGSIIEIGLWVLDAACQQAKIWQDKGLDIKIAVNLSAVQFKDAGIEEDIRRALEKHQLAAQYLEVEITETGFMENLTKAIEILTRINQSGISTAVDDFGTGYSSLSYLKQLPVDKLKIDKQFVWDMVENKQDFSIVQAIIHLGKSLNMRVIAEGVETAEQEAHLIEMGCNIGQGYYYSKPVDPEAFEALLTDLKAAQIAAPCSTSN